MDAVPVHCSEGRAESKRKDVDLPVDLSLYLQLWSRIDLKNRLWIQEAEMYFLQLVVGLDSPLEIG